MRIAFYAPLKAPTHPTPSGDRRVASLFMDALARAGHRVELASAFRSFDGAGDAARQGVLRREGEALAAQMIDQWRGRAREERPALWFTYHLYYKAPDWLGPAVSSALGIPYVVAEASHAGKRAGGAWAIGHDAVAHAARQAALVLCPSRIDLPGLAPLVARERLVLLPPFLDPAPYRAAAAERDAHRSRISRACLVEAGVPWIAVAAMMRAGDKLASYLMLADALERLAHLPWRLLVAGDGPERSAVEGAFARIASRVTFLNEVDPRELASVYAASDLYLWPAVNEAYGMALLEAQAAGVPVVSCAVRGVPEIVIDQRTGLLAPSLDADVLAERAASLLGDPGRRATLGRQAAAFVAAERSVEQAARTLDAALAKLLSS